MSEEEKDQRNKPLRKDSPERFQPKVLIIWLVIIGAILSLYLFSEPQGQKSQEWTIKEVLNAVEDGRIKEGTIKAEPTGGQNWSEIHLVLTGMQAEGGQRVIARGRLTDENLERLQASGLFKEVPASTLLTEVILTLLPFVIIIGILYFLFVRQLRNAGRGAMNFGKSKAKMLTRDRDKVTFADVAGCEEAKEEVQEIVEFLKDPKKFQRIGGHIPKGVLLVGGPGTGKTLLARAVAGEADVPFYSIGGSDFVEMFVGVGAARVRDMFEQGRKNAPCIIFIDEIDAVGRQRGAGLGGGNDEREQTLNSLLAEMDGFESHEGVIIIAATNRPDVLDSALLRPGRFDRQITIDMPDLAGREEILKVHAKKITMSKAIDLNIVARNTSGFSGADLENLLNEAALLAARYGKKEVESADLDEARDKIAFGRERRRLMDDEDKKISAYHEAGHALVAALIGDKDLPVHKVSIIPRGQSLGSTMFIPKKDILNHQKKRVANQICTLMGGRVSEEVVFDDITSGASQDIKMATEIARHMVCDWGMSGMGPVAYGENQDHIFLGKEITRDQNYSEKTAQHIDSEIYKIIDAQHKRSTELITERREALEKIAQGLLEYETLEGKHVYEIIEFGEIRSPVFKKVEVPKAIVNESTDEEKEKVKEGKKDEELGPDTEPALA